VPESLTLYPVIGNPPVTEGATQFKVTVAIPADPVKDVGGPGSPGLAEMNAGYKDDPFAFVADTENV
jgi:hypothetical protein